MQSSLQPHTLINRAIAVVEDRAASTFEDPTDVV